MSALASLLISRPIRKMAQAAESITGGRYERVAGLDSRDEIGDLARAFNEMIARIRADSEEITAGRSRLEAILLSMSEGVMAVRYEGVHHSDEQVASGFPDGDRGPGREETDRSAAQRGSAEHRR